MNNRRFSDSRLRALDDAFQFNALAGDDTMLTEEDMMQFLQEMYGEESVTREEVRLLIQGIAKHQPTFTGVHNLFWKQQYETVSIIEAKPKKDNLTV